MSYATRTPIRHAVTAIAPLGMDADVVWKASLQSLEVTKARFAFRAAWNAAKLTDANLPVLFVIDLLRKLADQMSAYRALQTEMLKQSQYIFSADEIYNANRTAMQLWEGVYADVPPTPANPLGIPPDLGTKGLAGVFNQAIEAKRKGLATMTVSVSNGKTLMWNIDAMLGALAGAYLALVQIDLTRPWYSKLGALTDGVVEIAKFSTKAIDAVVSAVKAGGQALYKPVEDTKDILVALAKISAFGFLGYLVYKWKK